MLSRLWILAFIIATVHAAVQPVLRGDNAGLYIASASDGKCISLKQGVHTAGTQIVSWACNNVNPWIPDDSTNGIALPGGSTLAIDAGNGTDQNLLVSLAPFQIPVADSQKLLDTSKANITKSAFVHKNTLLRLM
jgi:hypothetical protein